MPVPYNNTFTMVAGGVTITFNVRPSAVKYTEQVMISEGPLPGSNQSYYQNMGYGGLRIEFEFDLWNITSITMSGAPTSAQDIAVQLRTWHRNGTTIAVTTDHILEINGAVAMNMKILNPFRIMEVAGHNHSYIIPMILQQFNPGVAI